MADNLPSTEDFKLPDDVGTLSQMRDQLSDYLNTLERNTDSVNAWLSKHQNTIIVGMHQLNRALSQKDEEKALKAFRDLGETAGFVLSVQDFGKAAEDAFGKDSKFGKEIKKTEAGVPKAIIEDLPELKLPEANAPAAAAAAAPAPEPEPPKKEESKKSIWNPGTWFKGDSGKSDNAEEEAQRKIDEIKRHWRLVRSELISLQSDRHYYVDSFMDWVGETLAPENGTVDPETDKLMEKYQNPQVVIDLALKDYAEVMQVKAGVVRDRALLYSKTAQLIDEQRIAEFATMLPALFPETETVESAQMKALLLQDYGVASFAEMALDRTERRDEQLILLKTALQYENEFKLTGLNTPAQHFERVLKETLAAKDPLDSEALSVAINKMKTGKPEDDNKLIGLPVSGPSVFERIVTRFAKDPDEMEKALGQVLHSLAKQPIKVETQLREFVTAVEAKDAKKLGSVISAIGVTGAQAFKGLWNLSYPGVSLTGEIVKATRDTAELSALVGIAQPAGLLDELKVNSNAAQGDVKNIIKFLNDHVMPEHGDFSLNAARKLIGSSFAGGGLDQLRRELTRPDGWLQQAATGNLAPEGRVSWVAALLEPWGSNIVKSNILAEAARTATTAAARKALAGMEANLTGLNVRLDDERILTNIGRIANMWYDADSKVMRLTVNGTGHTVIDEVSPQMAKEILDHMKRREPGFESEFDGIYNPRNIDRIVTTKNGTMIYWGNHSGVLNVPEKTIDDLHRRDGFVHITSAKSNQRHSINLDAVTLLQPLADGTHLLVDKSGTVEVVEGKVDVDAKGSKLLDLNGTWFNPRNASILSLDADKGLLEFRAESNDFEDLLESAAPGQYFYSVQLGKQDIKAIEKAIADEPSVRSPGGSLKNMYFSFDRLGYMMYSEERETGFSVRKFGPSKKPGFVAAEESLANSIYQGLSGDNDLVTVGNVITHKSLIDDAYYNAEKQRFYMVLSNDILQVPCDEAEAYEVLKKLAKEDGFTTVGASMIQNPKGVGTVELPADIVNMNRAVLQFYSPAQEKTFLVAENDRAFHIGYDRKQADALFDALEDKGLEKARAATPKPDEWVKKLREVQESLSDQVIRGTPSLTELGRDYLLQQVVGKPAETRPVPQPKKDFSVVAAAPVKAGDAFTYPQRHHRKPVAPKP